MLSSVLAFHPSKTRDYLAFLDGLSQRDRHLLVLQGLHSQVCNGGFAQWIDNGYLNRDGPTLTLALTRMGEGLDRHDNACLTTVSALVDRAVRLIANVSDPENLNDEDYEALDALDTAFYAVGDHFAALMHGYFVAWA